MMLAPTLEKLIKQDAEVLGIDPDYVYAYSIDPNVRAHDVSHLVMLITEIGDTPHNYGSNRSLNRKADVQIQTFIPQTYTGDTSKLRDSLTKIMESREWTCTLDTGIEQDPSADILVNTTHWRKIH